ncbi:MAG: hypothetical protein AB7O50_17095 [Pseudolabrys sp.]
MQSIVLVTARLPEKQLYDELAARVAASPDCGIESVSRIGDCIIPATIAMAVFEGRRYAEELDVTFDGLLHLTTEPVEIENTAGYHHRHELRTTNSALAGLEHAR